MSKSSKTQKSQLSTVDSNETVEYVKRFFIKKVLNAWPAPMEKNTGNVVPATIYKVVKKFSSNDDLIAILLFIRGNRSIKQQPRTSP